VSLGFRDPQGCEAPGDRELSYCGEGLRGSVMSHPPSIYSNSQLITGLGGW